MISLNNLINLFRSRGQLDSADLYLEKGLALSRSEFIQDRQRIITYRIAGDIFEKRNQYDSALFYYRHSLALSEETMRESDPRITYLNERIRKVDSLKSATPDF
jgi:tetratricopeptide (TPR) repeat protein